VGSSRDSSRNVVLLQNQVRRWKVLSPGKGQCEDILLLPYVCSDGSYAWVLVEPSNAGNLLRTPYRPIDGQTSWFNSLDPGREVFLSDDDPEYRTLCRTKDGVTGNTVWIEFDAFSGIPTDQIKRTVIEFPEENRDGEPDPTIIRRDVAEFDPSQRDRLPHRQLSLNEAALWFQTRMSTPGLPSVLTKDIAERWRIREDASPTAGVATEPATAPVAETEAVVTSVGPKFQRGRLDETAAIELKKNPSLNFKQLATILGCREGTLRDRKKCPLLAGVKAKIQAERDRFREGSTWRDRRSDDDGA
jgi:hypothetical protein